MARKTKSKRMKRRDKEQKRQRRAERRRMQRREALARIRQEYIQSQTFTVEELAERWGCSIEQARLELDELVEAGVFYRVGEDGEPAPRKPSRKRAVSEIALEEIASYMADSTLDEVRETVQILGAGFFHEMGLRVVDRGLGAEGDAADGELAA